MGEPADPPIRLLLFSEHTLLRQGGRLLLEGESDITVVADTGDPVEVLGLVEAHRPDIVVVDTPPGGIAAALALCRALTPRPRVLVLVPGGGARLLLDAMDAGAAGCLTTDVDVPGLLTAIRAVHSGESGFDARSAALVVAALHHGGPPATDGHITERERQIVTLVAQGLSNRAIAERLYISHATVKFHVRNVLRKLGVTGRAGAVYDAVKRGLI